MGRRHPILRARGLAALALVGYVGLVTLVACVGTGESWRTVDRHRWWSGLGPVVPHDTFPADCSMCHVGDGWNTLAETFEFDHGKETGVPLDGAHAQAACLRCHNDRGPVAAFAAQGCAGCHEDVHRGQLGGSCTQCHNERSWQPQGMIEFHRTTRFPLTGVHASVSCRRCHTGSEVGIFAPTPIECIDCHRADLEAALVPDHFALGYVDRCDRCHVPFTWNRAELGGD